MAAVCHAKQPSDFLHYLSRDNSGIDLANNTHANTLISYALRYYRDKVFPNLHRRRPSAIEAVALSDLAQALEGMPENSEVEEIQQVVYSVGKQHSEVGSLRDWFRCLYQTLLGQDQGPRMGSFFALYGLQESVELIRATVDSVQAP